MSSRIRTNLGEILMVLEYSHTKEQIDEARRTWLPRLRKYASDCRRDRPLPAMESLSAAQREQCKIIRSMMEEYRGKREKNFQTHWAHFPDSKLFSRESPFILHTSLIGILAARDVFGDFEDCFILLLPVEKVSWFRRVDNMIDGWYGHVWWNVYDYVPKRFTPRVAEYFPKPEGFEYWVVSKGVDSTARHDVWKWDGSSAELVDGLHAIVSEHGPIREWYE